MFFPLTILAILLSNYAVQAHGTGSSSYQAASILQGPQILVATNGTYSYAKNKTSHSNGFTKLNSTGISTSTPLASSNLPDKAVTSVESNITISSYIQNTTSHKSTLPISTTAVPTTLSAISPTQSLGSAQPSISGLPYGSTYMNLTSTNTSLSSIVSADTNKNSTLINDTFSAANSTAGPVSARPQVSGTPTVAVANGSYAFASKNVSESNSALQSATTVAATPRDVFAHFMVGNVPTWDVSDWKADIALAQTAHIDAFALNVAYGNEGNADVIDYINQYSSSSAYYTYLGQPFVSTFEGPAYATDWTTIKADTGCFFMPDWSSLSAKAAIDLGEADGLLNWASWPWGTRDMDTHIDASFLQYLNQTGVPLPYIMPVSPWFFTNLPGYDKNWMWKGDDLWFDRWQQVWYVRPNFVEILTWNDYGESHYIGPLHSEAYGAFDEDTGNAIYNYALGMPHDGWRLFLPYVIDTYKNGIASVTQEGLVGWYRLLPADAACSSGNTSANTHTQFQEEFEPSAVVEDKVFYSALLASSADVTVTIGSTVLAGTWETIPDGNIGIYHGSVATNGATGVVTIVMTRSGATLATIDGAEITDTCTDGVQNWNAWVGYDSGEFITAATPTLKLDDQVCIKGTGVGNFAGLCEFACNLGYCPIGACTCNAMGAQVALPSATGSIGYPIAGETHSYDGLCAFSCLYGFCPDTACGTVSVALATETVSPFDPPACISGTGDGNLLGLCGFACNYGYCPLHSCTCGGTGNLVALPEYTSVVATPVSGLDEFLYGDLCTFACSYGYCPPGACTNSTSSGSGIVYIDPIIFVEPSPVEFTCSPPCTFIMPSSTMNTETVITFPAVATSIVVGASTILSITPAPMTTSVISFFDMPVESGETSFTFALTSSFEPEPMVITVGIVTTTVYFLPVAGSAIDASTTDYFYSLGTTVYVSGSLTQTFSEGQFTNLRTITAPTTITTSLVEKTTGSSSTTSSTTIVPIWVQAGGFYWSPVPLPAPTPYKIPNLPDFPPIPNPPCFTFLNIFSVDCPPDKRNPTSTFTSGETPGPTCTSNCGTRCTANCETTGTPTSTECSEATVTNYWVSCGTSCTTTSSATATGCDAVETVVTTTGSAYCPVITNALTDDEGSDDTADTTTQTIGILVSASFSESVIIGSGVYTVTSGSIVVGGTSYSIPSVSALSTIAVDGSSATIIPAHTGQTLSITMSGWSSVTGPVTSTSTTSTSAATTTSSLPIPTLTSPLQLPYCFSEVDDGTYVTFNITGADTVMDSICGSGNTLAPDGTPYTYIYTDPTGINVIAQIKWADDQSGCADESDFALSGDVCEEQVLFPAANCDDASTTSNYGGAYVANSDAYGCIEFMLYAQLSGSGSSTCSCNEDGCTSTSPACCSDGTCDTTSESTLQKVNIIPESAFTASTRRSLGRKRRRVS